MDKFKASALSAVDRDGPAEAPLLPEAPLPEAPLPEAPPPEPEPVVLALRGRSLPNGSGVWRGLVLRLAILAEVLREGRGSGVVSAFIGTESGVFWRGGGGGSEGSRAGAGVLKAYSVSYTPGRMTPLFIGPPLLVLRALVMS